MAAIPPQVLRITILRERLALPHIGYFVTGTITAWVTEEEKHEDSSPEDGGHASGWLKRPLTRIRDHAQPKKKETSTYFKQVLQ